MFRQSLWLSLGLIGALAVTIAATMLVNEAVGIMAFCAYVVGLPKLLIENGGNTDR